MAEEVIKSVTEELNCSICMNRFCVPKMLDCIHSFCERCLEDYVKKLHGKEMSCPMCRKICPMPAGVKGLQTNIYLVNLCDKIDLYEKLKPSNMFSKMCESCKKSTKVTAYCIDCRYAICDNCLKHHSLFPALQSHSVEKIGNVDQNKLKNIQQNTLVPSCDLHSPEKLRFFCKTCSKLICRECTVVQHPKPEHLLVEAPTQFEAVKCTLSNLLRESPAEERFVSRCVKDGRLGQNEIKMEFKALSKRVQDVYEERKSEIVSQLDKELKDLLESLNEEQKNKDSNIEESVTFASDWLKRMKSTRETTARIIEEDNMWELLAMSNNLIASFQALSDDKTSFKFERSDLNLEMLFSPSEMPNIRLGEFYSTNNPDTVICQWGGTFMKFHFDQEEFIIERTRVNFNYNSFAEEKLSSITFQFRKQEGAIRFNAAYNSSYSVFSINQYLLAVPFKSNTYFTLFKLKTNDTPIKSLAISRSDLCLVFCNELNAVYQVGNFFSYVNQYRRQNAGPFQLESHCLGYPSILNRFDCSLNVDHVRFVNTNKFFLATTESTCMFIQYNFNPKAQFDVKVTAPTSHQGFQMLSILDTMQSDHGLSERQVTMNNAPATAKMQNFVCFILWGGKIPDEMVEGGNKQLIITRYESLNDKNMRTWEVSEEVGIPRACYWDGNNNLLRVCNTLGEIFSLE